MELLRKSNRILLGGLVGSFITLSGPVSPISFNEETYTLEELAYQSEWQQTDDNHTTSNLHWISRKGFRLQSGYLHQQKIQPIRKAVFRMLKN